MRNADVAKCLCDEIFDVSIKEPGRVKRVWVTTGVVDGKATQPLVAADDAQRFDDPISRAASSKHTCVGVLRWRMSRTLQLVAARKVDADTVRVNAFRLDDALVRELLTARALTLAEQSSLTNREREVLELMLLGRSARDIAAALRISHSTAKFHQANVLDKVGAESRFDLFRLLG
jgi:DNA-binding CsgD family transcriptional regulator